MIDIHSHILPGVDDGARDLEESIEMLKNASLVGVTEIITTPHAKWSYFDPKKRQEAYDLLLPYARQMGINLRLGYEAHWGKLLEKGMDLIPNVALADTGLFLLEFSHGSLPSDWRTAIQEVQSRGFKVVIAHPERNLDIQACPELAYWMHEMGCLHCLSSDYLTRNSEGDLGLQTAECFLKDGIVDFIGSDAHRPATYYVLEAAVKYAKSLGFKGNATIG